MNKAEDPERDARSHVPVAHQNATARGLVGIDVGGTFTDLYFSEDGGRKRRIVKVPSTPLDPSIGLLDALEAADLDPKDIDYILHGTTIGTNAVIERRGARCALIATKGFRDVLELGRRDRPDMYGLTGLQRPLIPRDLRWEVEERIDFRGNILTPVTADEVKALAERLVGENLESIIVAFLHSYANPTHEELVRDILLQVNPKWEVVISSSVVREYYEFERTSTAVVQGYLQPLIARYTSRLIEKLKKRGFTQQTLVIQSNGGVIPVEQLPAKAANIVRSGPAAGVIAAAQIAASAGYDRIITGDMGGTSFDVAVVVDGKPEIAETTLLDFRIPLRLPMIDVHTIGTGGGSIAHIDRGGYLQVGPHSAGSNPGPVCWSQGGAEPTVTDANLVLARIAANRPIGGKLSELNVEAARAAIRKLGEKLDLGIEATAEAILAVANQKMAGRIRLLSIERGYDPRDFAMVIFGGAGPLHGAALTREVGIGKMIVPAHPGVLCALGCVAANVRHDVSRTVEARVDLVDINVIRSIMSQQKDDGLAQLHESNIASDMTVVDHLLDMSYLGQIHKIRVPVQLTSSILQIASLFEETYRKEYGSVLTGTPIVISNVRTTVEAIRPQQLGMPETKDVPATLVPHSRREVYFSQWLEVPVYLREQLTSGCAFDGPAIIEQADTTTVIEPGMMVKVDHDGNLIVEVL